MATYNKTNYYSTLGDTVYYTDLGQIFHDLSYGNVVNGVKTFTSSILYTGNTASYQTPILQSQTVNKRYVDSLTTYDPFYNITYTSFTKATMPNTNQVTSLFLNVTANLPTTTFITQGNILAVMDTPPNYDQVYTFGASKPGFWLAGGQGGLFTMAYSYDGVQWFGLPNSPFTIHCNAIAWNGTIWVAMGSGTNSLAYSYDGFNWTGLGTSLFIINPTNKTYTPYGAFAWNNYIWVAVVAPTNVANSGNVFLYSYDGINWIPNAYGGIGGMATYIFFQNVYWNGALFLACGNNGSSSYNMAYSFNGIQWYPVTSVTGSSAISAAGWNGTQWIACSFNTNYVMNSSDGTKWVQNNATYYSVCDWNSSIPTQIVFNGSIWICVGVATTNQNQYTLYYSWDGWNWTKNSNTAQIYTIFPYGFNNLAWNGYMWIACGRGTVDSAAGYTLGYSYNGLNWFPCYNPQGVYNAQNVLTYNCFCACWGGRRENMLYFPQNRTLVLGTSNTIGNTIAYSFDGSGGWVPSLYDTSTALNSYAKNRSPFLFSSANGAGWNGYMWVVGGTVNTLPYYTTGNTVPGSLNFTSNSPGSNVSYFSSTSTLLFYNTAISAYTIEAWIRIPVSSNTGTMGIAGIYNSGIGLATAASGGVNFCLTSPGATVSDNLPLNDNNWHHVAVSVLSGITNGSWYYVDGVQRPIPFSITCTAQSNPFCVGTLYTLGAGNQNFNGYITEVRVWNTALSATQIAGQWNSNVLPNTTGLVGYYSYNTNLPTSGTITAGTQLANLNQDVTYRPVVLTLTVNTNTISFDTTNKPTAPSTNFYSYLSAAYYPQHTLASSHIQYQGNTVLGNAGNVFVGMGNLVFSTSVNNVQWNGNVWVAVGQGANTLAYSPDGFTWFGLGNSIFYGWGNSLAWNGVFWVAMGRGANTIAYSPDGIQWTGISNAIFSTSGNGVAWNGTYWISVGQGGNTMAISTDGQTWTGMGNYTFTVQGNDIATNNTGTMWLAGGSGGNALAWSLDGMLWNRSQTANSIFGPISQASGYTGYCNSVTWNGRYWIAVGQGSVTGQGPLMNSVAHSHDGNIFTNQTNTTIYNYANRTVWNGNQGVGFSIIKPTFTTNNAGNVVSTWVAGGYSGAAGNPGNTLAYSVNGVQWTGLGTSVFYTNCVELAYRGNTWIGLGTGATAGGPGGNTLAYSANGNSWTGLGSTIFNNYGATADWNGYMWVAGGNAGGAANGNTLAYSFNGINWIGLGSGIFSTTCNNVTWQGSYWLAAGQGTTNTLAYSYNGIIWTGLGKFTFDVAATSVAWNGFVWVATGSAGSVLSLLGNTMAYSYNGINWTGMGSYTFTTVSNYVSWNGLMWVATGQGGNSLAYSYNGNVWTAAPNNGLTFSFAGNDLAWNGAVWVATGSCNSTGFGNTLAYSYNGINWTGNGNVIFSNNGQGIANSNTLGYGINYGIYNRNRIQLNSLNQPQLPVRNLDIVGDNYYQAGYNGVTMTIKTTGTGYPSLYSGY